jgi:CO/xanthine dehydrogenase FAD-binding subunit
MQEIDFYAADTLDHLYELLTDTGGRVLAGGTDVLVQTQRGVFPSSILIDASQIDALRFIREEAGRIHIGALTTYADLVASPLVHEAAPSLLQAAKTVGAPQTRCRGTLGGNIGNASPAGDMPPPLLALEAEVKLACQDHARVLPLAAVLVGPGQTILEPGEIIHSVSFPRLPERSGTRFLKLGNRHGMAIAVVNVAVALVFDDDGSIADARIALGAVAPTAVRSPHAEALLVGQVPSPELFERAGKAVQDDIAPITDIRGSVDYRRRAAVQLAKRALEQAVERLSPW